MLDQQVQARGQAAVAGKCFHDGLAVADHTGLNAVSYTHLMPVGVLVWTLRDVTPSFHPSNYQFSKVLDFIQMCIRDSTGGIIRSGEKHQIARLDVGRGYRRTDIA